MDSGFDLLERRLANNVSGSGTQLDQLARKSLSGDNRDRLYASYVSTHFADIRPLGQLSATDRAYFHRHFRDLLPAHRGATIVELGCGYGALLLYLKERGYRNVMGVDVSEEQVALAHSLGLTHVEHGSAEEFLTGRHDVFDIVLAVDLIEHLTRDELLALLDLIRTALRPGGKLVVQTVNAASPFFGRVRYGDLTHEQAFTASSIRQAFRACGLEPEVVLPVEPAIHGVISAIRFGLWQAFKAFTALYLAVETGVLRGHVLSQNLIAVAAKP